MSSRHTKRCFSFGRRKKTLDFVKKDFFYYISTCQSGKDKAVDASRTETEVLEWIQEWFGRGSQSADKETLTPQVDRIVQ